MVSRHEKERKQAEQARRDINRLGAESDTIGTSAAARMATKIESRFKASDIDPNDPIEVWGTRIGRGLGLMFAIGLALYLFKTYVLN